MPLLISTFHVFASPTDRRRGFIRLGAATWIPCALGRSGPRHRKTEGDGITPIGRFPLGPVRFRADHGPRPVTRLAVRPIRIDDGWCDDPADRRYNRLIRLPSATSHEHLWRDDRLYDILVEIGYNTHPRRRNAGSAIFLHIARGGFAPTEGCVAVTPAAMRRLLVRLAPGAAIVIHPPS